MRTLTKNEKRLAYETRAERNTLLDQVKTLKMQLANLSEEHAKTKKAYIDTVCELVEMTNVANELLESTLPLTVLLTHPSKRIRDAAAKHRRFIRTGE